MKNLNIIFEDNEFKRLSSLKKHIETLKSKPMSWRKFVMFLFIKVKGGLIKK